MLVVLYRWVEGHKSRRSWAGLGQPYLDMRPAAQKASGAVQAGEWQRVEGPVQRREG